MKRIVAGVLEVAYLEFGPPDGAPVILLHGFPYDAYACEAVGERLARLAEHRQLIVITHSPQVAARAQDHFRIEKSIKDHSAITEVIELRAWERREELARLLAGTEITDAARAAAEELLNDGRQVGSLL